MRLSPSPLGTMARAWLRIALVIFVMLSPLPGKAQAPSAVGRWTPISPSTAIGSNLSSRTAIHMALLRGDNNWASDPSKFHSYLLWWESRNEFCNETPKFHGALYGWRPNANPLCSQDVMSSGFTRLDLSDTQLDPPHIEAQGHDIFCAGQTLLDDGRLALVGGAGAENTGSLNMSVFDPHQSGNRWTQYSKLNVPRWYPTLVQTSNRELFAYSGLRFSQLHVFGGRAAPDTGARIPWRVANLQQSELGEWVTAEAKPLVDTTTFADSVREWSPREFAAATLREDADGNPVCAYFSGGADSTGSVKSDLWRLDFLNDQGQQTLRWWRFNQSSGDVPVDGIQRHGLVAERGNGAIWLFGGTDGFNDPVTPIYRAIPTSSTSHAMLWQAFAPANGPGPRVLASVAYDEQYNRMIVFGGYTDGTATTVTTDPDVWALTLNATSPQWEKLTRNNSASSEHPSALAEAAIVAGPDNLEHLNNPRAKANMYVYGGTDGTSGSGAIKSDLWLMYFPDQHHVSWKKLSTTTGPGPRKGALIARDHDSWNLRVYGGMTPSGPAGGDVWRVDIYRDTANVACDNATREWVAQGTHTNVGGFGGGRVGGIAISDAYELTANGVEHRTTSATDTWHQYSTTADRWQHFYPLLFPLPNNTIFDVTSSLWSRTTHVFDPQNPGWQPFATGFAFDSSLAGFEGGSAVLRYLADGTTDIMRCGMKDSEGSGALANGTTARIRLNSGGGAITGWQHTGSMSPRVFHNLVTLPTGDVLVTGGVQRNYQGYNFEDGMAVYRPQIWNGSTGTWSSPAALAAEPLLRGYHSTALLVPDGRILTGGGNDSKDSTKANNEPHKHFFDVFCLPSWFDASDHRATVPTLMAWPITASYGAEFAVDLTANSNLSKLVLLRPGAATHGFNSSQVYAELNFHYCESNANQVIASMPPDSAIPPGDYLLFAVSGQRASLGQWVRLAADTALTYAGSVPDYCDATPPPGGGGGGGGGGGFFDDGFRAGEITGTSDAETTVASTPRWVENSLFAGVPDGTTARDRLRLVRGPLQLGTSLRVRLRHTGAGRDIYSHVRLVAVDHDDGVTAHASTGGEVTGELGTVASFTDASGANALGRLGAVGLPLAAGDVYEFTLPSAVGGESALWLETSELPLDDGGIRIEQWINDAWSEVALHSPRADRDIEVVTGLVSSHLRLVSVGKHRLHGLGRFTRSAPPARIVLEPVGLTTQAGGSLAADQPFMVSSSDTLYADFPLAPALTAVVRDWFLEVDGSPDGYQPTAAMFSARHAHDGTPSAPLHRFRLAGGIPNPFHYSTAILFELPERADIRLEIFDLQGRRMRTIREVRAAGEHRIVWDRSTDAGTTAPRGVYSVRLTAGARQAVSRLTVR